MNTNEAARLGLAFALALLISITVSRHGGSKSVASEAPVDSSAHAAHLAKLIDSKFGEMESRLRAQSSKTDGLAQHSPAQSAASSSTGVATKARDIALDLQGEVKKLKAQLESERKVSAVQIEAAKEEAQKAKAEAAKAKAEASPKDCPTSPAASPSLGSSATLPQVSLSDAKLPMPLTVLSGAVNKKLKMTNHGFTSVSSWIMDNMMNGYKFRGSFVEFGCADGITGSNSYPFEQLGWEGLCIEPHIPAFKKAQKARKYTENALITPKPEEFTYWTGGPSCEQGSGIWEFYSPEYKKALGDCDKRGDIISKDKTVTWISIDCEGCEGPFIKSFDFTKYDVQVVNYEENTAARMHRKGIDEAMAKHGFTEVKGSYGDRLFTRKSIVKT